MTDTHARPTDSSADRLTFHITHQPRDGMDDQTTNPIVADPNAIFFWKGWYHFHYYGLGEDGTAFAHISSPDLVHWTWHPTVLTRAATGHELLSGSGLMTKEGRPAIIYASTAPMPAPDPAPIAHALDDQSDPWSAIRLGPVQIVHALDDQLDSWSAPTAIGPRGIPDSDRDAISAWDPHGWLEGDTYYAIYGAAPRAFTGGTPTTATVMKSADLRSWEYVGPLLTTDLPEAERDTDLSCPDFFPLGNEHMLLCISHNLGCRYYLGEWKNERFTPTRHGRMNWQATPINLHTTPYDGAWVDAGPSPAGGRAVVFAPETLLTPDGRRVMWAWCWIDGLQTAIQSLPRELSLPDDGILRIAPLRELETLRTDEVAVGEIEIGPTASRVVDGVSGDTLELSVTFHPGSAGRFGVVVLCDAGGAGGLPITVDTLAETVAVGDTAAPFASASDSVTLRVFLDKAMVEVFADDLQAVIGAHPHLPGNVHVGLFADVDATADVVAWRLSSIYPE